MRQLIAFAATMTCAATVCFGQAASPTYKKLQLSDKFYAEGAHFADFNKDGKLDIVAGPFWFEGPDFTKQHVIREPKTFDPNSYSDNFLTYTGDFNGDGWSDVMAMPWPGEKGYWYENPQGKDEPWKKHLVHPTMDNESPMMGDLDGDGKWEAIFNANGTFGFAAPDPAKPTEPWPFTPVTPKGGYQRYTHGVGIGDINGDGKMDLIEGGGWWEQPANWKKGDLFVKHPFKFADAAAQMLATDLDGDGLTDVITSWHCHQYGLIWWKQVKSAKGEITFEQRIILPPKPDVKAPDLRISQLHALKLIDMNNDGLPDVLTGKRFWSHGPKGDVEPDAPAVIYWFELKRDKDKGASFVPHMIDDNSGVGTQVEAADLNGDKLPDPIVCNKKGIFVFLSQSGK
jgi:hypothetical protein